MLLTSPISDQNVMTDWCIYNILSARASFYHPVTHLINLEELQDQGWLFTEILVMDSKFF